ncbi:protein fuzzy homolog [Copidosoma floridanum]|uniref:protein fuzzy homolog n=1 Tax=Copidosoma floridanum TaxID=29053 RepID=UPI0006C9D72A|nr:protein fuzzy homolog [Copidosoma floridanum]
MTAHIMCVTSSGGIPLFVRKKGDGELMTFSKMASLNGVHMFLKTHNIELINTDMPDTTVVWKEFKDCITLIVVASSVTKQVLNKFLNAVFNAMILLVGLKDIEKPRSIERLKKDLRICYPIIDRLLECLDIGDRTTTKTDIIDLTNCIMCLENHLLQVWELAYRLVSVNLVNNVQVLALCGPNPTLNEIERLATQCWRSSLESLRVSEQCYPRNFPSTMSVDPGVLGFLLVNCKIGKYILSRNTQHSKNYGSGTHRLDTLRTFYHHAEEILSQPFDSLKCKVEQSSCKSSEQFKNTKETYWCSEYHKCHALKESEHIIYVLYPSAVPTHTMRIISQKTLKILVSDKQICW